MTESPDSLVPVSRDDLRAFAGSFPTGVTVLTTIGADGAPLGLTMNAVSCVCLEPPLFLACVDKGSTTLIALMETGKFALNILAFGQDHVSNTFASKGRDKFAEIPYHSGRLGMPVIDGVLAAAEFRLAATHEAGDHVIVIGEAMATIGSDEAPLLYYRGKYGQVGA